RDFHVTGVQTCALPIWVNASAMLDGEFGAIGEKSLRVSAGQTARFRTSFVPSLHCAGDRDISRRSARSILRTVEFPVARAREKRSEERRVGKGWRTRRA